METPTYLVDAMLRVGNEIMNPKYIVKVTDNGLVTACQFPWSKGKWTRIFDGNPDGSKEVRSVTVNLSNDSPDYSGTEYFAEEAEALWRYFSSIAVPLMEEEVALDNLP